MGRAGYTTIELLMAATTGLFVTAAALSLCHTGNRFVAALVIRQASWQEVRAAAVMWTADWRGAGYDPTGGSVATVAELTPEAMRFSADWNASGALLPTRANPNERLSYSVGPDNWRRGVNSGPLLRMAWPDSVRFHYFDGSGRELGEAPNPPSVQIAEARVALCNPHGAQCRRIVWRSALRN